MADEKDGKGDRLGPFQLGRSCDEVGPELGHLREARNTDTGKASLVLQPGPHVDWLLRGSWRVSVSTDENSPSVSLEVERAPVAARLTKLVDILVLITTAMQKVEDSARVEAHVTGDRLRAVSPGARRGPRFGWSEALAVLSVLALGVGVALRFVDGPGELVRVLSTSAEQTINAHEPRLEALSVPMPDKPFRNQGTPPCTPHRDEVEIHGGCWIAVERRPPCIDETQSEYDGKCYVPVGKKERPVQSSTP